MKDFFLDGSISYSLEEVAQFFRETGGVVQGFEAFLNKHLRGPEADMEEVIAVGMALGEEVPYTHAITLLTNTKDDNLIISDSAADSLGCWPCKPPGYGDKPIFKLGDLTDQYIILSLFKLKREIVTERRRELLERELYLIMTGEEKMKAIKEKEVAGAFKSHLKRSSTSKKRRGKGSLSLNKSRKQLRK
jgi:hypothetical protein